MMSIQNNDALPLTKVENFHLPPLSSVIALGQSLKRKQESTKDSFKVTNNGKVNIAVEVLHSTRNTHMEAPHNSNLAPNESFTFELDEHFHNSVLKVTNNDESEEAVFSAEGGNVVPNLEKTIKKINNEEHETKLEDFVLPPRSTVLAMVQDVDDSTESKPYTVTNHGNVELFVEVSHLTRRYEDSYCAIVKPSEVLVIPIEEHLKINGLRLTNNNYEEEALFTVEGGYAIESARHSIEHLPDATDLEEAPMKVVKSMLPPRSYVPVLSQCPEGEDEHPENFIVTNNGSIPFEVEVVHPTGYEEEDEAVHHRRVVKPQETTVFELDDHFHLTVLNVINRNSKECAVFTAEGGHVIDGFHRMIRNIPDENGISHFEQTPSEIERFVLNVRSHVKALIHDPNDENMQKHTAYTVTNHGYSNIEVQVLHADKESRENDEVKVLKPKESVVIEHLEHAGRTVLNIINKSYKEFARFSAKGGEVIHDFERMIRNIPSPHEKVMKLRRFRLSPRTSVVVMKQATQHKKESKEDNENADKKENKEENESDDKSKHDIDSYSVTNMGHEKFTVEVIQPKENDQEEKVIRSEQVNPKETKMIELDNDISGSSLKIVNNSYKEIAVFSAEGGEVIHEFDHSIQELPEQTREP